MFETTPAQSRVCVIASQVEKIALTCWNSVDDPCCLFSGCISMRGRRCCARGRHRYGACSLSAHQSDSEQRCAYTVDAALVGPNGLLQRQLVASNLIWVDVCSSSGVCSQLWPDGTFSPSTLASWKSAGIQRWAEGSAGESCDDVCSRAGLQCDETGGRFPALDSQLMPAMVECASTSSTNSYAPFIYVGTCYYRDNTAPSCTSKHSSYRRLCPCGDYSSSTGLRSRAGGSSSESEAAARGARDAGDEHGRSDGRRRSSDSGVHRGDEAPELPREAARGEELQTTEQATGVLELRSEAAPRGAVSEWSTEDVSHYVRGLAAELGDRAHTYADAMAREDIDGVAFVSLSGDDLDKLGVSIGHRKRLMSNIARLTAGEQIPVSASASGSPMARHLEMEGQRAGEEG